MKILRRSENLKYPIIRLVIIELVIPQTYIYYNPGLSLYEKLLLQIFFKNYINVILFRETQYFYMI